MLYLHQYGSGNIYQYFLSLIFFVNRVGLKVWCSCEISSSLSWMSLCGWIICIKFGY